MATHRATAQVVTKPSQPANVHLLEQGFGVHVTKLGPGEKEEGYAMTKTRVKWFLTGIFACLLLLSILVGVYAGMFNDERVKRMFMERKSMEMMGDQKAQTVRLGLTIQQQEAEREHQENDVRRALKRIGSVINKKFDELLADVKVDQDQINQLREVQQSLSSFVNGELVAFEKEKQANDVESKKRLEKLAKFQEQSLRELLNSVSGVKMDALEEMLEEVFEAGKKAPTLEVSDSLMEEIEDLADSLYEGTTDLDTGRKQLDSIRRQIIGELPEELSRDFAAATDADLFAQALDELIETTKLARGKKEIAAIEESWRKEINKVRDAIENGNGEVNADNDDDDDDDDYDEEVKLTVDALLGIHRLVAEGKVPVYLLDFEAIDLHGDDNDDGDGENDDDGSDGMGSTAHNDVRQH